jgi:hypothetical protein
MFKKLLTASVLLSVFAAAMPSPAVARDADLELVEEITPGTYYRIHNPRVDVAENPYYQIVLRANDTFWVRGEGCVQTGGSGKTWKRYVNPSGPNSDHLYHGRIQVFGSLPMTNLDQIQGNSYWSSEQTVNANTPDSYLTLGYSDDSYSDNGYWGHDDGTENQCAGIGNAMLEIYIEHH